MKFQSDRERRRYFARRKSGGGPEVHYGMSNGNIVVEFSYAPERVKAIKKLGARYRPADKRWTLAAARFAELEGTGLFPRESAIVSCPIAFLSGESPGGELHSVERNFSERSATLDTMPLNPFSVPEPILALDTPDIVIRGKGRRLALRVFPRLGQFGQRIVEGIPGAHFVNKDHAYWIPTQELVTLIKKIRDKGLTFAVEEGIARRLKDTADERARILGGVEQATPWILERCGLIPYVSLRSSSTSSETPDGPRFELHGFTGEQWRQMMTLAKIRTAKKADINIFSATEILNLLGTSARLRFKLWRTAEVDRWLNDERARLKSDIDTRKEAIADYELELAAPSGYWTTREERGAIILQESEAGAFSERIGSFRLPGEPLTIHECVEHRIPFSELARVYETIEALTHYPISTSFDALLSNARKHRTALIAARQISDLTDVPVAELAPLESAVAEKLFPHQRVAVKWISQTAHSFLGDDMGLGKTLSVLASFSSLHARGAAKLLLVVAPTSLLRNWQVECARWFPEFKVQILSGQKSEKTWMLRLIATEAVIPDVLVLNYEACRLEYVRDSLQDLVDKTETFLCLDESQRVKNPASKTFESLVRIADKAKRRILLSGTPAPRDMADLWAQFRVLDGGQRFGKSYYRWLEGVAELGTKFSDFAVKGFRPGAVEEVMARAHEVLLRRRKEEVINLPEKIFVNRFVPLRGDQLERYEEIREALLLTMRTSDGKKFTREITNILEQYLRGVQVASNPRLLDPQWKGDPVKFLEVDAIVEEVVAAAGGKIVLWTNYLHNVTELTQRYAHLGARAFSGEVSPRDRQEIVTDFQNDRDTRVLIAVPAAGGVGITLTAAQTAVYIDRTWNAEHWLQSIDRIHRIGQRGAVSVITLSSCGIDELIGKNLKRKSEVQSKLLGDQAHVAEVTATDLGMSREEFLEAVAEAERGDA